MLIAFNRVSDLFLTGQTSTHSPQPVQSSGATWSVKFLPGKLRHLAETDLNVGGAAAASAGS